MGGGVGEEPGETREWIAPISCLLFVFFLKCKGSHQETGNHPSYFKCRSFNPGNRLIQWKDKKWMLR